MQVLSNKNFSLNGPLAATIGFFDGVHSGHRFLLDELKRLAQERSLPSAVITFPTHPRVVLQTDFQPELLTTYEEKIRLLEKTGIDYCIVLDFDLSLAEMSAEDFIKDMLFEKMNIHSLLIGYDHRFGHNRSDGFDKYVEYGATWRMEVIRATSYTDNGLTISSSKIRNLIHAGDMATANAMLGYNYRLKGQVIEGNKIGRALGFPTANIGVTDKYKLIPAFGSYAVHVFVEGVKYKGMLFIGTKTTIDEDVNVSIEVNIFDFCEDIYNKQITVEFIDYIRENKKFPSLDELKMQLEKDREKIIKGAKARRHEGAKGSIVNRKS
ncbi:MAG: riboflavin biosynthesis protein RibF [Tannerella sp.]|jgi:riboflavin kinase/FMN adenylyltransferase|nr:riboflavin biosynthesis protein RibF [Tannerella sp.]